MKNEAVAYLLYCIESYKIKHNITGAEAQQIFKEKEIDIYILENFGALHTTGIEYVLEDLEEIINNTTQKT